MLPPDFAFCRRMNITNPPPRRLRAMQTAGPESRGANSRRESRDASTRRGWYSIIRQKTGVPDFWRLERVAAVCFEWFRVPSNNWIWRLEIWRRAMDGAAPSTTRGTFMGVRANPPFADSSRSDLSTKAGRQRLDVGTGRVHVATTGRAAGKSIRNMFRSTFRTISPRTPFCLF